MYANTGGRRGGTTRCDLRTAVAPIVNITPPKGTQSPGVALATKDPNLEEPPELGPEVTCFLRGSTENSEEEDERAPSPEPPVEELQKWVIWKAEVYETPSWWRELMMVPGVEEHERLAWEVWASF